jgi:creatinine amidohydrolase
MRVDTFLAVVRDVLDALYAQGFRRIVIVNGHGGNSPAAALGNEWLVDHAGAKLKFHNWWNAPRVWAKVQEIDPVASHASWMESFPWTRVAGATTPDAQKAMIDWPALTMGGPDAVRAGLGDGNFGGRYIRSDEEVMALWRVAIAETRALAESW